MSCAGRPPPGIEASPEGIETYLLQGPLGQEEDTQLYSMSVYTKRITRDNNRKVRCPVPDPQSLLSSVHTFPRAERRFLHSQRWGVWLLRQSTSPILGLCESSACGISQSVQRLGAGHLKKFKLCSGNATTYCDLKKPDSHRSWQLWLTNWVGNQLEVCPDCLVCNLFNHYTN